MPAEEVTLLGGEATDVAAIEPVEPRVGAHFVGETDPGAAEGGERETPAGAPPVSLTQPPEPFLAVGRRAPARQSALRHVLSPLVWSALLLLALVLGAILAITVHLVAAPGSSPGGAPPTEAHLATELTGASLVGAPGESGPVTESAPAAGEPSTTHSAVTAPPSSDDAQLRGVELAAALALRADDCLAALPLYRQLAAAEGRPEWQFASALLESRCGAARAEHRGDVQERAGTPLADHPDKSLVVADLAWLGGPAQGEGELRVLRGGELREVVWLSDSAPLWLPPYGGQTTFHLRCPQGYDAEPPTRTLPATLPKRLSLSWTCRRAQPQRLVAVLTAGEEQPVSLALAGVTLGQTRGQVAHFLISGQAGEALEWIASVKEGYRVEEPRRVLLVEAQAGFSVETFVVRRTRRLVRKSPAPRPTRVPYRL